MAFEQRDNSGSLFRNDRKEKDSHPDHKGSAKIDGKEYWVSAWIKEGSKGRFFSLAFTPKDEQKREQRSAPAQDEAPFSDEIPF
jgi:hypothetical protein